RCARIPPHRDAAARGRTQALKSKRRKLAALVRWRRSRVRADEIAAALFRSIKRGIGALDQVVRNRDFGIDGGDAEADREPDAHAGDDHRHLLYALADALRND